ncbi:MAG: hypothetical protein A2469_00655 [Candidatus Magasanikbacteria bacterium RIFOXYC2_FULL_40_16]|uniref:Uncharacterized protein n=3 Tax=Candidatus Magasanikiibacteriota TaxID=1752731 RepID=A0A1F6NFP6_9BACT|nr:MAG: hypothetical protein A2373_01215 [Candidatus Magasanikbacteria bacterium RIFOXYB1_FULL_40_15]OGH86732.1 MAG: hypothetical protein A2301_00985 [Candidatus Magasanikbacteria bacterium RIFOXYB2_FULL_40_13]OGH87711.1 MAG: hypothetical protein A2206_02380 [Candidatus Magasanikbacteria bacterium RIFOXYA1_FULL_40_8]OGH89293.1 MAG: hypothetical protein A2469_00655 [Candidatus Magasanikbacteria bacterium RIFOXYC2_FULL_40_16]
MMTTRKKIFIFSGLIAGIIIAIILLFIFLRVKPQPTTPDGLVTGGTQTGNNIPAVNGDAFQDKETGLLYNTNVNLLADGAPKQDVTEQYLRQLAGIFVERFNSYSNQNDNTHIEDALEMSTEKMAQWINTQRVVQSRVYEGVITEVLSTKMERLYDTRAVIKVQAKITNKKIGSEEVEYKTGFVDLLEVEENEWLVDKFVWEQ